MSGGREEEKSVINQVATEGKKRLLLTMRLISQLRRAARMGQEENPWYKDQFLWIAKDFIPLGLMELNPCPSLPAGAISKTPVTEKGVPPPGASTDEISSLNLGAFRPKKLFLG